MVHDTHSSLAVGQLQSGSIYIGLNKGLYVPKVVRGWLVFAHIWYWIVRVFEVCIDGSLRITVIRLNYSIFVSISSNRPCLTIAFGSTKRLPA